jgi:hypothetical protein
MYRHCAPVRLPWPSTQIVLGLICKGCPPRAAACVSRIAGVGHSGGSKTSYHLTAALVAPGAADAQQRVERPFCLVACAPANWEGQLHGTVKRHHLDRRTEQITAALEHVAKDNDTLFSTKELAALFGVTVTWLEIRRMRAEGPDWIALHPLSQARYH